MAEAGSVFVSVIPSLRNFNSKVKSEVRGLEVEAKVTPKMTGFKQAVQADLVGFSVKAKVEPDMTGFKTKVNTALAGITGRIGLQVNSTQARNDIRNALAGQTFKVRIEPDLTGFKAAMRAALAAMPPFKVKIEPDLALFRTRLATLKVPNVNIGVDLDTGRAMAKLLAFTRTASKLSIGTLGIGAAIQAVGALGAALVPVAGAVSLLPAIGVAGVAAFGALKIGTQGFGDAVKAAFDPEQADKFNEAIAKLSPQARATALAIQGMGGQFKALRMDVQDALFRNMAGTLQSLGASYLPMARTGFTAMATSINSGVQAFAGWLNAPGTINMLRGATDNVTLGFDNLIKGSLPAAGQAFTTLAAVGATKLPALGNAVSGVTQRFNEMIQRTAATGQLSAFMDQAIAAVGNLMAVVGNLASIFGSIFQAAGESGANFLVVLRDLTGQVAAFLNSTQGMDLLRMIFTNIATAVRAVMPLFSAIGNVLVSTVLPAVAQVLPMIGQALGSLAPAIAPLGQIIATLAPVFASVLAAAAPVVNALVMGLKPVIVALAPLVTILANSLGTILVAAANALSPILTLIAQTLTTTLAPVLPVIAQTFAMLAATVGQVLLMALQAVAPILPVLGQALIQILQALQPAIPIWGQFVSGVIQALAPLLPVIVNLFLQLVQALLPILPAFFQLAQVLLPILVAGLNLVIPVITFLANILSTILVFAVRLVVGILTGLVNLLTGILTPVVQAAGFLFQGFGSLVSSVWGIVRTAISTAWTFIRDNVFTPIGTFLTVTLPGAFNGFLNGVVVPVWNAIRGAINSAWLFIRDSIWNPIIGFIRGTFNAAWQFLINGIITPVWNNIKNTIMSAWNFIRDNVWNPIIGFIRGTFNAAWQHLVNGIIIPVWNRIKDAIRAAWDFIKGLFNSGIRAVEAVGAAFDRVSVFIRDVWGRIREWARAPVKFVVDVVYNGGIRPVWNGIASLFGMGQLPAVGMATGGVLPGYTPGRDYIPTMLSGGEGILVPEAVRGLGPAFVGWANRTFSRGRSDGGPGTGGGRRFSRGGVAHFAGGGIIDGIGSAISGGADFFMNVFTDPAGAVKKLFSKVIGDGGRTPGSGGWTDALKRLPGKAVEGIIGRVKKWIEEMASMMGGSGGNWAPVAAQALAITGQPQSLLWRVLKQIQIESGGNPRAINLWDSNARKGTPSKGLIQTIDPTFQAYRHPGLPNNPYHPLANIVAGIRYAIARYGSIAAIWPKTMGYDSGGMLPPGVSMAVNATGGNERMAVFTRSQWSTLHGVLGALNSLPATVNAQVASVRSLVSALSQNVGVASSAMGRSSAIMSSAAASITSVVRSLAARVTTATAATAKTSAPRAGMVRAEDGTWVPASFYAKRRKTTSKSGMIRAEDGTWVPRSFYGYDRGGVATGVGAMLKQTIRPERVLSPRQTVAFERLIPMLAASARGGVGIDPRAYAGGSAAPSAPVIGAVYQTLPEGVAARQMVEELTYELRRNGLARGVHGR